MVADFAIHDVKARDGGRQPHAHVMTTTRAIDATKPLGFGGKVRAWDDKALVLGVARGLGRPRQPRPRGRADRGAGGPPHARGAAAGGGGGRRLRARGRARPRAGAEGRLGGVAARAQGRRDRAGRHAPRGDRAQRGAPRGLRARGRVRRRRARPLPRAARGAGRRARGVPRLGDRGRRARQGLRPRRHGGRHGRAGGPGPAARARLVRAGGAPHGGGAPLVGGRDRGEACSRSWRLEERLRQIEAMAQAERVKVEACGPRVDVSGPRPRQPGPDGPARPGRGPGGGGPRREDPEAYDAFTGRQGSRPRDEYGRLARGRGRRRDAAIDAIPRGRSTTRRGVARSSRRTSSRWTGTRRRPARSWPPGRPSTTARAARRRRRRSEPERPAAGRPRGARGRFLTVRAVPEQPDPAGGAGRGAVAEREPSGDAGARPEPGREVELGPRARTGSTRSSTRRSPRGGPRGTASVPAATSWATDEGTEGRGRAPRHPEAVARGSSVGKGPFGAVPHHVAPRRRIRRHLGRLPHYEAEARAAQADAIRRPRGKVSAVTGSTGRAATGRAGPGGAARPGRMW